MQGHYIALHSESVKPGSEGVWRVAILNSGGDKDACFSRSRPDWDSGT